MPGVVEHQKYGLLTKHLLGRGGVASGNIEMNASGREHGKLI